MAGLLVGTEFLTDLTSHRPTDPTSEEVLPSSGKSKYEAMDFDSLLKEAQQSLH